MPGLRPTLALGVAMLCAAAIGGRAQQAAPVIGPIDPIDPIDRIVGPPADRVLGSIDESRLVTLKGTVSPLASAANDRGAAPGDMPLDRLQLVLKRSPSQEAALRALLAQLHAPGSPQFHKWLTPEEFGAQFGPSDDDIAAVKNWLAGHGFSVIRVNPGKETMEIAGNVDAMRSAFHTSIHRYQVNGETHYANADDPAIPAALAPVVGGFFSLNNFRPKRYSRVLGKAGYNPRTGTATPQWTIGTGAFDYLDSSFVLSPADFALQYDLNPLYASGVTGAGQSIAIVNESNINVDLVNQFRSVFLPGAPANPPQVIVDGNDPGVDGMNNYDGPNYASTEAYLDVEWAGAVAPNATIDLVIAADTVLEDGLDLAASYAVYTNVAPVISLSFGQCELYLGAENQAIENLWEQAAAQGITVVVSAGDAGPAACDDPTAQDYALHGLAVNGYASTPFNVAVGGTDFYYSAFSQGDAAIDAQLAQYWSTSASNSTPGVSLIATSAPIPEQPWNDSQYGDDLMSYFSLIADGADTSMAAGGGGMSNCSTGAGAGSGAWSSCTAGYAKPAWQQELVGVPGSGMPNDNARDLPDISLFAADGLNDSYYPICAADGDCQPAASGSLVQFTGIGGVSAAAPAFAAILALVNQKYGRQGQADNLLYPLWLEYPAAFYDVRTGTNTVPCAYAPALSPDCIGVTNPIEVDGSITEGEIGSGTAADYSAGLGYDLASGLGSIDANALVTGWGKVKFGSTTTTLTPSSTAFTHGTAITINGSVTGAGSPTGDVALMTDSPEYGNQSEALFTLANGAFTSANDASYPQGIDFLPGGTYHIWGQYGGDAKNALSTSAPVLITVNPEPSAIDLNMVQAYPFAIYQPGAGPGTPVDYGTQLLLSAAVAPGAEAADIENCLLGLSSCSPQSYTVPTGAVTFTDAAAGGSAPTMAVMNTAGDAEYNAPFAVGSHAVTASYNGDASYTAAAATAPITFTVAKDTPVVSWAASNSTNGPIVAGQPIVFNVTVENDAQYSFFANSFGLAVAPVAVLPPTGTVAVSSAPAGISGTVTLSPGRDPYTAAELGVGAITLPATLAAGAYTVTFAYSGDANYAAETVTLPNPVTVVAGGQLLPSTIAATMSGSLSPNSTILVTGTVTGESGQPAPTGAVLIFSSGSTEGEVNLHPGSLDASSFSALLNSQVLNQGANFVTLEYSGDANYNPSGFTLNNGSPLENLLSDFTMVPDSTILPVSAGSSASVPINLSSLNGFAGAVNLTCAASTVTCTVSPSVSLASGGGATAALTISASSGAGNGTYNVMVTGADAATGEHIHTLGFEAVVSGSQPVAASFSLSASMPAAIAPGASTASTVTATAAGGYAGTIALSCALTTSPGGATDLPSCTVTGGSPVTLSAGTTSGTATVKVATTAPATAKLIRPAQGNGRGWLPISRAALALIVFLGVPMRRRRGRTVLALALILAALGSISACGGGSINGGGGGGAGSPGTTAGTYIFTVTGTGNPAVTPAPGPATFTVTVN
ncbi:MAG TPA: protease pro-enzyme activation domain-containing protein [Terracidiphilus sp.]|nr:protease pro-enzyme activation domain-containing protein [Terracidiphilus sp.]